MRVRYIKYKCAECGAEDTDKIFSNESPVPAVNCWSCRAGHGIPNPNDQAMRGEGMLMVRPDVA